MVESAVDYGYNEKDIKRKGFGCFCMDNNKNCVTHCAQNDYLDTNECVT